MCVSVCMVRACVRGFVEILFGTLVQATISFLPFPSLPFPSLPCPSPVPTHPLPRVCFFKWRILVIACPNGIRDEQVFNYLLLPSCHRWLLHFEVILSLSSLMSLIVPSNLRDHLNNCLNPNSYEFANGSSPST